MSSEQAVLELPPTKLSTDVSNAIDRLVEAHSAPFLTGTRTGWPMRATYLLSDVVSVVLALLVANLTGKFSHDILLAMPDVLLWKLFTAWSVGLFAVACLHGAYSAVPPRPVRIFRSWVLGASAVCGSEIGLLWLFDAASMAHFTTLCFTTVLAILAISFNRAMCRIWFGKTRWWGTRLVVVGSGGSSAESFAAIDAEPQWGLRPVGFVDDTPSLEANIAPNRYLGSLDRLNEIAERLDVDRAVVTVHSFNAEELCDLLSKAGGRIRHWIIMPQLDRFASLWLQECEVARLPALAVTNRLALPSSLVLKRLFDIAVVGFAGLLALPLIVVLALLVRFTSRGPIFYGQERVGQFGRRFKAWKFRTMVPNADAVLANYLAIHPELAAEWQANHKLKNDPRITWIGRWMRAVSLDELPQIWNVLVGEMSLVGPRPIVTAEIDKYADRYKHFVQVLPGITGLWQVSGRNNTTYEERVDLDTYYVQNWSLWLDVYILACTVKVVLRAEGAY